MGSNSINIWAISPIYWPVFSGSAIQAQRLYSALSKHGLTCTVLSEYHPEVLQYSQAQTVDGVMIRGIPTLGKLGNPSNSIGRLIKDLWFTLVCIFMVIKHHSEISVIHMQSVSGFTGLILPLARLFKIPTLVKLTMLKFWYMPENASLPYRFYAFIQRKSIMYADKLILLSDIMLKESLDAGMDRNKLSIISQGIDFTLFYPVTARERADICAQLNMDPDMFYICFVGSIIERKGVDILVDAFIKLSKDWPQVRLILAGKKAFDEYPGTEEHKNKLNSYCDELIFRLNKHGVANRVTWTGILKHQNVTRFLQASSVFCFPSRLEGVPSALLEAMACGLPVIASEMDGTARAIFTHGEQGFISTNNDVDDYVNYIEQFLKNEDLRNKLGQSAYQRTKELFSFEKAIKAYMNLYDSLIFKRS